MPKFQRETALSAGLVRRNLTIRANTPETVDEGELSVEATVTTETRAQVFDYGLWEELDEVLLASGRREAQHVVLLDSHRRGSVSNVLGSLDQFRTAGRDSIARLTFDKDDPDAVRAFNKVRNGHLRAVSIGYEVNAAVTIEPGESVVVEGREYKAGARRLRIATAFTIREASLVPIGADEFALIRAAAAAEPGSTAAGVVAEPTRVDPDTHSQRGEAEMPKSETATEAAPVEQVDASEIERAATKRERERVDAIREAAAGLDIDSGLVRRAESEGWTVEKAGQEFLAALRESRSKPVRGEAPGQISRSHEKDCTVETLSAALAIRCSLSPVALTRHMMVGSEREAGGTLKFRPEDRVSEASKSKAIEHAEIGERFATMSLLDVCREGLRLAGVEVPHDRDELIQRAFSTPAVTTIFTNVVGAKLLSSYEETSDTTVWCAEEDVVNFKSQERHTFGSDAKLKRLASGGTADHASADDDMESYRIHRFARRAQVDDQVIIDDDLGMVMTWMDEFGRNARQLRPDLVYGLLNANAALSDTIALFHASHNNLTGTAGLAQATLQAAIGRLSTQTQYGRNLNLPPAYLIVPQALRFTAKQLLNSSEIRETGGAAANGTMNPLVGENITPISEARLDNGVTDPIDDTTYAGSGTTWYLATRSGRHTVVVGYLTGTGRAPQIRSSNLAAGSGSYGIQWDIKLDIGAKALDYRGLQKQTA